MEPTLDDRQLVEQSMGGSREAFGRLVDRYRGLLCAITYSTTGSIEQSEELAQEAFLQAWRNLNQLRDLGRFRVWLCTIARNLASRAAKRRSQDAVAKAAQVGAIQERDPAERLIDEEQQKLVWAALEAIPANCREPMVLFYRKEQSVRDVAEELGVSEHVVRQRLYRGRQLLKAELASLVEETLARSGPGKAFVVAVVAALPALTSQTASAVVTTVAAKATHSTPAGKALLASGLSGAILGPILGLLGGVLGAWCSIKNTNSPRERRFMIQMTIFFCIYMTVLMGLPLTLALAGVIAMRSYWMCAILFFVSLGPLILWGNARQRRIQIEEGTYRQPATGPSGITPRGIYASFGGGTFGATSWLVILAGIVSDWPAMAGILVGSLATFYLATAICVRNPQRYWSAAVFTVCAFTAVTLTTINLRWEMWMERYRHSRFYEPANDVSLTTINLLVVALCGFLLTLSILRLLRSRAGRRDDTSTAHTERPCRSGP